MQRINLYCPIATWRALRAACALEGISASKKIVQLIDAFLRTRRPHGLG